MKKIFLLLGCFTFCLAAPADEPVAIISQNSNIEANGAYQYSYETANGIKADETGSLKSVVVENKPVDVIVAQGSFSYTAPDGTPISISYVADDEGGFAPKGDHLPTPPPIPPAIQKALDYLASLPPAQ